MRLTVVGFSGLRVGFRVWRFKVEGELEALGLESFALSL